MHNHSNVNELRILMQIKLISLLIVELQDSLRNRDKQQLGNGPFHEVNTDQPQSLKGQVTYHTSIKWTIAFRSNESDFRYIRSYCPYQNIRDQVCSV